MFEKELERERKALKSLLATSDPYVTLQAILANERVHVAYRRFFESETAWWVHEERAIRTSNPRFDTADAGFVDLGSRLDKEYTRTSRFDHEELNASIDAAVKTRLNFLCRPRTTLKWFVFRGEPTKPIHEVVLRLGYFDDYKYLTDGIRTWARNRGSDTTSSYEILSIIEFERVIENVDNDAILDLSQDQFVSLLDPLYLFFADASPDIPPETVPTEAVIIFLDDKGAIPISQALERMLYREELKYLTRSKFLDVIDTVIEEIENSQDSTSREIENSKTRELENSRNREIENSRNREIETVDSPVISVNVADAKHSDVEHYSANEPVETETDIEENPALKLRQLRFADMVDSSQREKLAARLFKGDLKVLEQVMTEVLMCEQWKDAMATLDRWYARHGIEPNGAAAMELAHSLNRTYR